MPDNLSYWGLHLMEADLQRRRRMRAEIMAKPPKHGGTWPHWPTTEDMVAYAKARYVEDGDLESLERNLEDVLA